MPITTLRILDQVNCKFENLDPMLRRKIVDELKFMVPYARHTPSFKLGRWDGKVGFATVGGATYLNLLDRVLPLVLDAGYEVEIADERAAYSFDFPTVHEAFLADMVWQEGHPLAGQPIMLREHQVEAINTYLTNLQSLQSLSTSAGKAQPIDCKVLTPSGWVMMGAIAVGDLIRTPDGGTAPVSGVYPQGKKDVYQIRFSDGRTTRACGEHLWTVGSQRWTRKGEGIPTKTLSTLDLIRELKNSKAPGLYVPLPVLTQQGNDQAYDIDPYVLGALIGDGNIKFTQVGISSADQEVLDNIQQGLHPDYELRHRAAYDYSIALRKEEYEQARRNAGNLRYSGSFNHYRMALDALGLAGCGSEDKFIPASYFDGSYGQRLSLLQGLLDTDGYAGKNGYVVFTTVSGRLAEDVIELVRSLGGIAKVSQRQKSYTHNGVKRAGRPSFDVSIRHPRPSSLFRLSRKKSRLRDDYRSTLRLEIVGIEHIGTDTCQCIMVDHPDHLYITDNYIVTHNTIITACLSKIVESYGRSIIIVPNKSLVQQTEEDYRAIGLDVGVFFGDRKEWDHKHTICTWQSLSVFDKKTKREESAVPIGDFLKDVVCVMVDEAHSLRGNDLKNLLTGSMADIPIRWGLTGTIPKEDFEFLGLLSTIGPVVGEVRAKTLQDKGILSSCNINVLQSIDKHVEFTAYDEEYKYLTTDRRRLAWIAETANALAEAHGNTLILVDRIETGEVLNELIPDSVFIHGAVKTSKRREEYKSIQTTNNKVLICTTGTASTGINIPRLFALMMVDIGKSFTKVIQSVGRLLRTAADKDHAEIYDVCSTLKFSAKHLTQRKKMYTEAEYPFEIKKVAYRD